MGIWQAELQLTPTPPGVDRAEGGIKAWDEGSPEAVVGDARLEVTIDDEGTAQGSLTGPVELELRGTVDGEVLRARLASRSEAARDDAETETTFRGVLVAHREPGAGSDPGQFKGTLRLSSSDSHVVRHALVVLAPASPANP